MVEKIGFRSNDIFHLHKISDRLDFDGKKVIFPLTKIIGGTLHCLRIRLLVLAEFPVF